MLAPMIFLNIFGPWKKEEYIADILCYIFHYYCLLLMQNIIHQYRINSQHSMLDDTIYTTLQFTDMNEYEVE